MRNLSPSTKLLFDRLLALLAVDAAAAITVVVESGKADFKLAGLVVAASVAAAVMAVGRLLDDARPSDVTHVPNASLDKTKKILILAMLAGVIALVGGRGTWSSFSAETKNANDSVTSGLLTLSDQVNNAQACLSTAGLSQDNYNYNAACGAVFAPTDLAPGSVNTYVNSFPLTGSTTGKSWFMSKVLIQNTGTIDAAGLSVMAPFGNAVLSAPVNPGPVTSLTFAAGFEGSIASNDKITLSYQGNTQSFCTSAAARPAVGAAVTSITVATASCGSPLTAYPATTALTWPTGTRVYDESSDATTASTNCYDVKTAASSTYNFNLLSTNALCQTLEMWIQEQVGAFNYCWFGVGSALQTQYQTGSAGACVTPTTQAYAGTTITSGNAMPASFNLGTLNGNILTGDHLVIKESNVWNECPVTGGPYYIGSSAVVTLATCTTSSAGPGGATTAQATYDSNAVVYDKTAMDNLNTTSNDVNSTVASFDTARHQNSGAISLAPVTGNNQANTGAAVQLAAGATRTFYVGVYFPGSSGSNQNSLQGIVSTFGILWHMDQ